jgi:hypothetical protein
MVFIVTVLLYIEGFVANTLPTDIEVNEMKPINEAWDILKQEPACETCGRETSRDSNAALIAQTKGLCLGCYGEEQG